MKNTRLPNFFFIIIAIILGVKLFKDFDLENLKFEKPALDIIYLIGFIFSIFAIVKNYKKPIVE